MDFARFEKGGQGLGLQDFASHGHALPKGAAAAFNSLSNHVPEGGQGIGNGREEIFAHNQHFHWRQGANGGAARPLIDQGHLAKEIAWAENAQLGGLAAVHVGANDFDLAMDQNIEIQSWLALTDDVVTRSIVRSRDAFGGIGARVGQVARKHEIPRPVKPHLGAPRPRGEFEEIDAAPQKPSGKSGEAQAEEFGHRTMGANGAELAQGLEAKWLGRLASPRTHDIVRCLPPLAFGKLAGGRARFPVVSIDNVSTVANGPGIVTTHQAHVGLGHEPIALFGPIQAL